jgi:hypothetical protein
MLTITVFGNPIEPQDSLAVKLVPQLRQQYPEIEFQIADPTESLEPTGNPWIIIDVAIGINKVTVIEDLKDLEPLMGSGAHDYDVYMELRLKEKLGQLPAVKLLLIPAIWTTRQAIKNVVMTIKKIISAQK